MFFLGNVFLLSLPIHFLCHPPLLFAQRLPPGVPLPPDDNTLPVAAARPPAVPPPIPSRQPAPAKWPMPPAQPPAGGSVDLGNPSVSVCGGFGWTIYSGFCYKVVAGKMDWNTANGACQLEDPSAKLASIEDAQENRFIGRMASTEFARSRQMYQMPNPLFNSFWIGLRRVLTGGQYQSRWVDGKPVTFGNEPAILQRTSPSGKYPWGHDQPSGTNMFTEPGGEKEECVHMFSEDGQWNDAGCGNQMTGAICKKAAQF